MSPKPPAGVSLRVFYDDDVQAGVETLLAVLLQAGAGRASIETVDEPTSAASGQLGTRSVPDD